MDKAKVVNVLNNKEIRDILYDEKPVWIQSLNDNIATVGFLDGSPDKNVYIEDLYESDLYNK